MAWDDRYGERAQISVEELAALRADVVRLQEELQLHKEQQELDWSCVEHQTKRAEAAEAKLHEYAECPFCGESCERGEYTTVDGLKRQLTALEEALFPCQVMWAESCVCSRGTKGCVMTHLSDPPSALQVAEAEINEYSSRVVRLAEEGEQLRRKLAKAMKVVEAMDQVINICHTALIQIEGHHGCTAITERARVSISKLDSLHEFDEETL
jgi:predicted  nucleic acid-binding Zn-ribbon protein